MPHRHGFALIVLLSLGTAEVVTGCATNPKIPAAEPARAPTTPVAQDARAREETAPGSSLTEDQNAALNFLAGLRAGNPTARLVAGGAVLDHVFNTGLNVWYARQAQPPGSTRDLLPLIPVWGVTPSSELWPICGPESDCDFPRIEERRTADKVFEGIVIQAAEFVPKPPAPLENRLDPAAGARVWERVSRQPADETWAALATGFGLPLAMHYAVHKTYPTRPEDAFIGLGLAINEPLVRELTTKYESVTYYRAISESPGFALLLFGGEAERWMLLYRPAEPYSLSAEILGGQTGDQTEIDRQLTRMEIWADLATLQVTRFAPEDLES